MNIAQELAAPDAKTLWRDALKHGIEFSCDFDRCQVGETYNRLDIKGCNNLKDAADVQG